VENVSSIYNVYKSWQKRSQLAQAQAEAQLSSVSTGNIHNPVAPVPRPSDMFYGKIIPALKEKGIKRVVSRRDWPLDVKRKVLLELMNETPKQILWQEMWCASEGFRNFNSKVNRYVEAWHLYFEHRIYIIHHHLLFATVRGAAAQHPDPPGKRLCIFSLLLFVTFSKNE
jgi:hypothetical protein